MTRKSNSLLTHLPVSEKSCPISGWLTYLSGCRKFKTLLFRGVFLISGRWPYQSPQR